MSCVFFLRLFSQAGRRGFEPVSAPSFQELNLSGHNYLLQNAPITLLPAHSVPVQREMESGRSPLVSIPPFGRGFSRYRGLPIRSGFLKSAEAEPPRSGHRPDEPARLSLGMVASPQSPPPFRLVQSL